MEKTSIIIVGENDLVRDSSPNPVNVQTSPHKALRAAMLKRRFSDTIFNATHHHQLYCCNKKQKRELEKEKEKERQRVEAEFEAAQRAVYSLERTAARKALEEMEKSVRIVDDYAGLFKDLQMSFGESVAYEIFYGKGDFLYSFEKIEESEVQALLMELEEETGEFLL